MNAFLVAANPEPHKIIRKEILRLFYDLSVLRIESFYLAQNIQQ